MRLRGLIAAFLAGVLRAYRLLDSFRGLKKSVIGCQNKDDLNTAFPNHEILARLMRAFFYLVYSYCRIKTFAEVYKFDLYFIVKVIARFGFVCVRHLITVHIFKQNLHCLFIYHLTLLKLMIDF